MSKKTKLWTMDYYIRDLEILGEKNGHFTLRITQFPYV